MGAGDWSGHGRVRIETEVFVVTERSTGRRGLNVFERRRRAKQLVTAEHADPEPVVFVLTVMQAMVSPKAPVSRTTRLHACMNEEVPPFILQGHEQVKADCRQCEAACREEPKANQQQRRDSHEIALQGNKQNIDIPRVTMVDPVTARYFEIEGSAEELDRLKV